MLSYYLFVFVLSYISIRLSTARRQQMTLLYTTQDTNDPAATDGLHNGLKVKCNKKKKKMSENSVNYCLYI